MAPPVVLLPSPLLPIQAYHALAVAFEAAGPDMVVAAIRPNRAPAPS